MTHRDQLRLAIEMQNGIVDKFVAERMAVIDARRAGWSDDMSYRAWLRYGEQSTLEVGRYQIDWAGPTGDRSAIADWWAQQARSVRAYFDARHDRRVRS